MDRTCSVGYVLVVNVQKEACCSQISEIAIFKKIVKSPFLQNVNFFSVFQCGAPSCSHAHNELGNNLVNENTFLKKCVFYVFCLKN